MYSAPEALHQTPNQLRRRRQKRPKLTNSEIFKQCFKTVAKEYCAESSICGLKYLVSNKTPFIERLIWVVTLILAVVCSTMLVKVTFDSYYSAPLITTQLPEGVSVSKIIFPAVSVCPNNRISKRAITKLARDLMKEPRNAKYNETEMLLVLFGLRQLYNMQPLTTHHIPPLQLHQALGEYDVSELIKSLTPRCEELLVRCAWNEVSSNCTDLFDFRLTANGYCCTFNYLRKSDLFDDKNDGSRNIDMYNYGNKSSFDYDQGLKVLIRFNHSDDFYYNVPMMGGLIQFSDAYDFPDSPSGSYSMQVVSPSMQMSVLIEASFTEASRDIQHVPVRLRQCLFHDESSELAFYTSSDCKLKCRMLFLLAKCNCTPYNMPKMSNTRTCDMRDVVCLRTHYAQSITYRPNVDPKVPMPEELELDMINGGISCPNCYPTCSKTDYNYDIVSVRLSHDQMNSIPDNELEEWLHGANFTDTSVVHVKYAKDVADCYGQNVIMKWFDLISNIGSTCGFVTGFSFVSLLEFVYFFCVKLYREVRLRRGLNKVGPGIENPIPTRFEIISRYRPIYWNELTAANKLAQHTNVK